MRVKGFLRRLYEALTIVYRVQPGLAAALIAITLTQGLLPITHLWISKLLIDDVAAIFSHRNAAAGNPNIRLFWLLSLQAGALLAGTVLSTVQAAFREVLGDKIRGKTCMMVVEKANSLDVSFFDHPQSYDKIENARQGARQRPLEVLTLCCSLGQAAVVLSSMCVLLVRLHWACLPWVLLTGIPLFEVQRRFGRDWCTMMRERAPELRRQFYLEESLTSDGSIHEIRAYDLGSLFGEWLAKLIEKFHLELVAAVKSRTAATVGAGAFAVIGWLIAAMYLAKGVASGSLTVGDFALYVQAISGTQGQVQAILGILVGLYSNELFLTNLFDFLAVPASSAKRCLPWREPIRRIEFRDVGFSYPNAPEYPVLRNLSFAMNSGDRIAVVGPNASGKSTLVKLLCLLYEPSTGEILINGKPVKDYDPCSVRERIAVLFQNYGRYQLDVSTSIGLGDIDEVDNVEDNLEAARLSGAYRFIEQLPDGFSTVLGKAFGRGIDLSGGQWRQLALARALRRKASVLVLDEPTAESIPRMRT